MVTITAHDEAMAAESLLVSEGLEAFSRSVAPLHQVRPLSCFARAEDGQVIGGAVGRTWGRCCELLELWVHQNHRGTRIGLQLVREFEAQAASRGCNVFYLTTFSFQAPDFYRRLGYQVRATVSGFSGDIAKHTMIKVTS